MTSLRDFSFQELKAGMKFSHPEFGVQIILDLNLSKLARIIHFHDCEMYDGEFPKMSTEVEQDLFKELARKTYPKGSEDWEYLGMIDDRERRSHGWKWFSVKCPHCSHVLNILAEGSEYSRRRCVICGVEFDRQTESATDGEHNC
jgi:hypothetical protein